MSSLQSFFKCKFIGNENTHDESFTVDQREIVLVEILEDGRHKYDVQDVAYKCQWTKGSLWDNSDIDSGVCVIIPIRDDHKLLNYTLDNLREMKVLETAKVIVVDDRSKDDGVKVSSMEHGCSYLRVDNDKGFNFSMLCNLGASAAHAFGDFSEVLMWNSDLWATNAEDLHKVIEAHRTSGAKITGTKLVYPPFSWDESEKKSNNMKISFDNLEFDPAETIQFGGGVIMSGPGGMIMPEHLGRFQPSDATVTNVNTSVPWVTGAFHLIDLKWFLEERGYNPSLSKAFQDVDLCLRACLQDGLVLYAGRDIKFYHDESLQHCTTDADEDTDLEEIKSNKFDSQFASDMHLFSRIWAPNLHYIMTRDRRIPIKPIGEL